MDTVQHFLGTATSFPASSQQQVPTGRQGGCAASTGSGLANVESGIANI